MRPKTYFSFLLLPALLFSFIACEKKPLDPKTSLQDRGRIIYQTNCTACHHSNPRQAGSIGPDVFGSSRALIEARVLRAEYPPGHPPKRNTHAMTALPHLKNEIDALTAYLNTP